MRTTTLASMAFSSQASLVSVVMTTPSQIPLFQIPPPRTRLYPHLSQTTPQSSKSHLNMSTISAMTGEKKTSGHRGGISSHKGRFTDSKADWRTLLGGRGSRANINSRLLARRRLIGEFACDIIVMTWRMLTNYRLKESDVTWLYGPLKPATTHPITHHENATSTAVSRNASFTHKKPILKKRSMSEVMLQRSISASSLLKQAAASIEAQGQRSVLKKSHERTFSDFVPGANSEVPSRDQMDYFTSKSTSGTETPSECREKRHIRFDDKVEQCIAVDCKRIDEDDDEAIESESAGNSSSDSEDDGMVMMKRLKRPTARRGTSGAGLAGSRNGSHSNLKTIETLPSTTLKYKREAEEGRDQQQPVSGLTRSWSSSRLSPSASQETLRPTRPSRNFLLGQDEDEDDSAATSGWSFGASNPKSSLGAAASPSEETPPTLTSNKSRDSANAAAVNQARANGGYAISRDSFSDDEEDPVRRAYGVASSSSSNDSNESCEMEGMRRTESGMFMPYEEDEDDLMAAGMFGRISETVNTARDIAHVLWNVGWRK
jgi:hypothetical protein